MVIEDLAAVKSPRATTADFADPRERLVVVRAGHVITADRADQLAPTRFQPLRANRAIPGGIFVLKSRDLAGLRRHFGQIAALCRLSGLSGNLRIRGGIHGSTVITQRKEIGVGNRKRSPDTEGRNVIRPDKYWLRRRRKTSEFLTVRRHDIRKLQSQPRQFPRRALTPMRCLGHAGS